MSFLTRVGPDTLLAGYRISGLLFIWYPDIRHITGYCGKKKKNYAITYYALGAQIPPYLLVIDFFANKGKGLFYMFILYFRLS